MMLVHRLSFALPAVLVATCASFVGCGADHAMSAPAADPGAQLSAPNAPDNLRPGQGEILTVKAAAKGTQNY
jgi:hypothetical protein